MAENSDEILPKGILEKEESLRAMNYIYDLIRPGNNGGYRKDVVSFVRDEQGNICVLESKTTLKVRYLGERKS